MENSSLAYIRRMPELAPLLEHADHIDVKTVSGSVDLRTFLANMFSYQPDWITALYAAWHAPVWIIIPGPEGIVLLRNCPM